MSYETFRSVTLFRSLWEPILSSQILFKWKMITLPEREKDDRLDGKELKDRVIGGQQLLGGKVEQEQGVQGQADGDVVDDCDV